jgi:hypothetical protein
MRDDVSTNYLPWFAVMASVTALAILAYLKHKFVFESGNLAGSLVLATYLLTATALILGFVYVRRWQGITALLIAAFVTYFALFTPLYAVS